MTDTLRDRIAAVQSSHMAYDWGCRCGWEYDPLIDDSHFDHVADKVIESLGLQRASRPNDYDHVQYPPGDRYITEWITREPRSADKLGLTGDGE